MQDQLKTIYDILTGAGAPAMAQMNAPSYIPPPDATQEFRVQTNKFTAEYSRTTGAVVNFSIKSGTNQLLGSVYEFFRNKDLNANDFFQNRAGNPRAPFNQNQFGGSVGGPIRKDKTFFFANVEEYRRRLGAPRGAEPALLRALGAVRLLAVLRAPVGVLQHVDRCERGSAQRRGASRRRSRRWNGSGSASADMKNGASINPTSIPGRVITSGMIMWLRSIKVMTMRDEQSAITRNISPPRPNSRRGGC